VHVFDGKWQTTDEQTWQATSQALDNMSRGKNYMAGKKQSYQGWQATD
jgi:hypothetical protein